MKVRVIDDADVIGGVRTLEKNEILTVAPAVFEKICWTREFYSADRAERWRDGTD